MNQAVVLLSGGMDSATLLAYVRKRLEVDRIVALSFVYGQKHSKELDCARWQADRAGAAEHRIIDISFYGELTRGGSALTDGSIEVPDLSDVKPEERMQPSTYVPNRNMIFLALAAAFAEAQGIPDVFYGAQAQDEYGYWDCSQDFVNRMNEVLSLNRKGRVKVRAPFAGMSKSEVVKIGLELGVDYDHTWTCYRGGDKPCGTCPSCVERNRAFSEAAAG
jgi:7-cyano-7-deazaguanine synthase